MLYICGMGYSKRNNWTKELLHQEALKYDTKLKLRDNNLSAYNAIYNNKWQDEMFSHITIVGEEHNSLTILKDLGCILLDTTTVPARYVECICDCGKVSNYRYGNIKNGHTKSCGCEKHKNTEKYRNKNCRDIRKNKLYSTYVYIKKQCYSQKCEFYPKVGGVGIKMCDRWKNDIFNFYLDVGERPSPKHKLVRVDFTKDFEPNNMEWRIGFSNYNPYKSDKPKKITKPISYNTYEKCRDIALQYNSKWELGKNKRSVYSSIHKNGWFDLFSHMDVINKTHTKEDCHLEALKYTKRVDFQKKSKPFYSASRYRGWLDDVCSHMGKPLTLKMRLIYVYEFSDNHGYVGLTCDADGRHISHMRKGPVYKHMKKTGLTPLRKVLTDYIGVYDAKKKEEEIIDEYKNKGWILLNSYKAGGTGGVYTYTKNRCKEESLKYDDVKVFTKERNGYYHAILRNKWYELLSHMENKPFKLRTKDDYHKIALRYSDITEFRKKENRCYCVSKENGWIDDITTHMIKRYTPNGWWDYNRCKEESKKYKTRTDFSRDCPTGYENSRKNGWLNEFIPK
jgi:hypothetical protein